MSDESVCQVCGKPTNRMLLQPFCTPCGRRLCKAIDTIIPWRASIAKANRERDTAAVLSALWKGQK